MARSLAHASAIFICRRGLSTLGANPSAVLGTGVGDGASASPGRARDLQGRLDVFVAPKINAAFASWTELLIVLEENSQISGVFLCSERSQCFVWTERREDLPGRNKKGRRPRGLDGFLDLHALFLQACMGLKGDRW